MKLRTLCEKDAASMLAWMQDPAVNQFFRADFAHKTMTDVLSFIRGGGRALLSVIMLSVMTTMRIREPSV